MGGTWNVYTSVRKGLAERGIEVRWLGVGPAAHAALHDPQWQAERNCGEVAGDPGGDDLQQAGAIMRVLEAGAYDGVFVNAACNRVHSNVVRYLDPTIHRIMTVHTISIAAYAGASALREWVNATIGVSPRIRDDLVRNHGFDPATTLCIPNSVDTSAYARLPDRQIEGGPLRLLSLGRIADADKGIFWLPRIMDELADCDVRLTIAGDGPDRPELERRCAHLGSRVHFSGRIAPADVAEVASRHDVFLFPSRFEGFGLALIEAMAAGCVPVASRIKGVTDFVVTDEENGLLFDIGNCAAAARHVRRLAADADLRARMAALARSAVLGRFEQANMARDYMAVVERVMATATRGRPPLPLSDWSYPPGLRPGLRKHVPDGLKKWLRVWRERLA